MNSLKFFLVAILAIVSNTLFAQTLKTDSIKVYGNCSMCKKRIESAIKTDVQSANWNYSSKLLVVSYDTLKTTMDKIQQKIAAVGHDTEKYPADDEVYSQLPGCCRYDRKAEDHSPHQEHANHHHK
jgi:periplasmic mercuric ion binding protein